MPHLAVSAIPHIGRRQKPAPSVVPVSAPSWFGMHFACKERQLERDRIGSLRGSHRVSTVAALDHTEVRPDNRDTCTVSRDIDVLVAGASPRLPAACRTRTEIRLRVAPDPSGEAWLLHPHFAQPADHASGAALSIFREGCFAPANCPNHRAIHPTRTGQPGKESPWPAR